MLDDRPSLAHTGELEVVAEWTWLDVEYPTQEEHDAALADGSFVRENMCPIGLAVWGGVIYQAVPRLEPAVPVTLGTLVFQGEGDLQPLLRPFPNWEMQEACE